MTSSSEDDQEAGNPTACSESFETAPMMPPTFPRFSQGVGNHDFFYMPEIHASLLQRSALIMLAAVLVTACGDDGEPTGVGNNNPVAVIAANPPSVPAGDGNQTVVTLDASGSSDPESDPLTFSSISKLRVPPTSTALLERHVTDDSSLSQTTTADRSCESLRSPVGS